MAHPYEKVAILGGFNTEQARGLPGHNNFSIALEATLGVVDATGIDIDDIDGIFGTSPEKLGYTLGLDHFTIGRSYGIPAVLEAAQAIAAGVCNTALIVHGGAGMYTKKSSTAPWTRPNNEWVVPFGLYTAAEFALVAQRHMHVFGTTREQMATVAATIRNNGSNTPGAVYYGKGPFTVQDILDSRPIAEPFNVLDCSMTSEGGCALLLTNSERAGDAKLPPVRVLGGGVDRIGPGYTFPPAWDLKASRKDDAVPTGYIGRRAAEIAFRTAGLTPQDVDVCEFYDPFSFEVIRQLEAYGFCAEGEGGKFVMGGRIELDGELPITTDGGLMSYSHAGSPQLLQRVARATAQVQGICETNQIEGAEVVLASNNGSAAMAVDVILVGKEL